MPNRFPHYLCSPRRQMVANDGHEGDAGIFADKKLVGVLCGRTIDPSGDEREELIRTVHKNDFRVLLPDGYGLGFCDACFAAEAEALGCPVRPTSRVTSSCHPSPRLITHPLPLTSPFPATPRKLPFGLQLFSLTSRKAIPAARSYVGTRRI